MKIRIIRIPDQYKYGGELNARKWKHANGGYLYDEGGNLYTSVPNIGQHGGNFSNGVTIIGNGGTHEENPMEGVPMGIALDGTPNLVEQGEVKFNNYIFSNRLFATGGLLAAHNLPTTYADHSFADIAERLSRESSERPNDPISKRGLISSMTRLQQAQEQLRAEKQSNKYAKGGHLFATGGPEGYDPVLLTDPIDIEKMYDEEIGNSKTSSEQKNNKLSLLRYAPVLGSAIGLGYNIFNKPDYSGINSILDAANSLTDYTPVEYNPIGNYLQYKPLDRNYYTNKLNAQSNATRRAIMNSSNPSRNAALLMADYNAQEKLGDLARQAEEYNLAQRQAVETFNRGTNMANSEMGLKAAIANQEAALKSKSQRLSGIVQAVAMKDIIDSRKGAGISTNLTNLFDSLGNIGKEEVIKDMIKNDKSLLYDWIGTYKGKTNSKGGYLTIKNRRK